MNPGGDKRRVRVNLPSRALSCRRYLFSKSSPEADLEGDMKRHSAVGSQASYDANSRKLPSNIADKIGKQLRDIYDAVVHEPLPDQFRLLLSEIDYARGHRLAHA
jgi:hypothetical protein